MNGLILSHTMKKSRIDSPTPLIVILFLVMDPLQTSKLFTMVRKGNFSRNFWNLNPLLFCLLGSFLTRSDPPHKFPSIWKIIAFSLFTASSISADSLDQKFSFCSAGAPSWGPYAAIHLICNSETEISTTRTSISESPSLIQTGSVSAKAPIAIPPPDFPTLFNSKIWYPSEFSVYIFPLDLSLVSSIKNTVG